jgi:hypothetical protein
MSNMTFEIHPRMISNFYRNSNVRVDSLIIAKPESRGIWPVLSDFAQSRSVISSHSVVSGRAARQLLHPLFNLLSDLITSPLAIGAHLHPPGAHLIPPDAHSFNFAASLRYCIMSSSHNVLWVLHSTHNLCSRVSRCSLSTTLITCMLPSKFSAIGDVIHYHQHTSNGICSQSLFEVQTSSYTKTTKFAGLHSPICLKNHIERLICSLFKGLQATLLWTQPQPQRTNSATNRCTNAKA